MIRSSALPLSLVAVLFAGACTSPEPASQAPIGTIDGTPVPRNTFVQALLAEHGAAAFTRYAEARLVEKAAEAAGVSVAGSEVATAVDRDIADFVSKRFGGQREKLDEHLAQYGQTFDAWRRGRLDAKRIVLLAERTLRHSVDEGRVRGLFEQRYGKDGVKRQARHILISTQVATSRAYPRSTYTAERAQIEEAARATAFDLRRQLLGGADFAALAKAHSDDPSAKEGGNLGTHWSGRNGPRFDDAVRALAPGRLSPVVQGRRGFHVIRVDGFRKGARYDGRAILVSAARRGPNDPGGDDARFSAAHIKALALKARIDGGEEFGAVAGAGSSDRLTAAKGGALGPFGPGRLGPTVDPVLETLPLNTVSAPIRTRDGYVIVELSSREFIPAQDKKLVRHLLVSTEYAHVKARRLAEGLGARSKAQAEALFAQAKAPDADFAALAREHSEDELSRRIGGAMSEGRVGQLGSEVTRALASMQPGEVRLVQSDRGYHVLRLDSARRSEFAAVRAELEAELRRKPVAEADVKAWIRGLRARAAISYTP